MPGGYPCNRLTQTSCSPIVLIRASYEATHLLTITRNLTQFDRTWSYFGCLKWYRSTSGTDLENSEIAGPCRNHSLVSFQESGGLNMDPKY